MVVNKKREAVMSSPLLSRVVAGLSWLFHLPWKLIVWISHVQLHTLGIAKKHLSDPYFIDFYTELNGQRSARDGHRRKTEWINMGYWKDTNDFPAACEALALKLIEAAHCKPKGIVLDVGHGCGDSLLLHLEHPSVPRPQRLVGITSQRQHYLRSLERTTDRNTSSVELQLSKGDAIYRIGAPPLSHPKSSSGHPLDAQEFQNTYTSILALDCAYHFDTRHIFLEQSFACLAPGGRIALGDLCFIPGSLSISTRIMVTLMGSMPRENMITTDQYIATLRKMGYTNVQLENITRDVFPGFVRFLKGRGLAFRLLASYFERLVFRGLRFVIVSASKPRT
ncbi:hypothetical protein BC835DRAFT_1315477 [Cytidiella melzeri]|nr:hypothetical protein BC835DRAFT_1315477 [Cytidiella melzeri]